MVGNAMAASVAVGNEMVANVTTLMAMETAVTEIVAGVAVNHPAAPRDPRAKTVIFSTAMTSPRATNRFPSMATWTSVTRGTASCACRTTSPRNAMHMFL